MAKVKAKKKVGTTKTGKKGGHAVKKKPNPKTQTVHIVMILDRSGSMQSVKDDVIGGVNSFVRDQQKAPGKCTFTLVQFDDTDPYEVLRDFTPIETIKEDVLTAKTYIPRGMTPLMDAVGKGISNTKAHLFGMRDKPDRVIFVIQTDGQENASKEYTGDKIREMITETTKKDNWQFVFLGANMDAVRAAGQIGIQSNASLSNAQSGAGYRNALLSTSKGISAMRSSGEVKTCCMIYTAEDRLNAMQK